MLLWTGDRSSLESWMSEQDLYTCSQTLLLAKTTGMMNKLPTKYYTFVKTKGHLFSQWAPPPLPS